MSDRWEGNVKVLGATDKALRVEYEGEEEWVPISQIDDDSEIYSPTQIGQSGSLIIPDWLARKKGWS